MYIVVFHGISGTCIHIQGRGELAPFDPEIKRTSSRLWRQRRVLAAHNCYLTNMAENLQQNSNLRDENGLPCGDGNRGNNNACQPVVQPDDLDMLLEEFALPPTDIQFVIHRPPIQANNF